MMFEFKKGYERSEEFGSGKGRPVLALPEVHGRRSWPPAQLLAKARNQTEVVWEFQKLKIRFFHPCAPKSPYVLEYVVENPCLLHKSVSSEN